MENVKEEIINYVAQFISTNSQSSPRVLGLCGSAGIGKCFSKGTEILMFDGRVKKVEECKYVDEVIVDCQQIFDKEFMEKHQIDYIGMSDEYIYIDGTIHESYQYAKSIERILLIQRTPGISSTQLREQLETKDKQL
jgi:glycerol-3-phosphate cytidylyltransferase-like family protein